MSSTPSGRQNAQARAAALAELEILDTAPEPEFDEIVNLATLICEAPYSQISLIDLNRQWFKANVGFEACETSLDRSVCKVAVDDPTPGVFVIPDLRADPRTRENPAVTGEPHLRFYAGARLVTRRGVAIGTLCVLDHRPRPNGLTAAQAATLTALANQAMNQIDLRRSSAAWVELVQAKAERAQAQDRLAREESEARYRTLFNTINQGFCIIELLDGRHGPLSDYVHVEANSAFTAHTGFTDGVGRTAREMLGAEADKWAALYAEVLRTGQPARFVEELETTNRCLEIEAHRVEPASRRQVAVLFQDVSERQRVRERFRLAIEATNVGIFDYNLISQELAWDARVRELFGVAPDAPVSYEASFLAGLHPDDRERADAAVVAALDPHGPSAFEIEYRVRALDTGEERWLAARGQAVVVGGRTVRFVGTVRDITAAKAADDAIRATEERYRLATRATNDAIWDWDLITNHVLWNTALTEGYGHAPEAVEPTGDWWIAHIHPEDRQRVGDDIHAVIDGKDTAWTDEYRFQRADGTYADVFDRGFVIRDGDGRAMRMIGAMLDLTERKRTEAALRQLNETLEDQVTARTEERNRIWQHATDLLSVTDTEGRFLACNPAWTRALGYTTGELAEKPFADLVHPDDHVATRTAMATLLRGEAVTGFENRYRHKDGSYRWLSWNAVPTEGRIFSTTRDVTEAKAQAEALEKTEEALRQAQKMEAVGQLTGGLAHDFNNLLAGISGSLELMNTRIDQGRLRDVEKYMVAAQGAAKRAASLTHRLLAFSRRQTLAPKPTKVNTLVSGMLDLIQRTVGPSIAVETVCMSGLWPALVDPSQLENALLNLCINARDAMPAGGRITIETGNRWIDRHGARQQDMPEGQYLSLCVSDTGTGMPPEVVAKAFDPFFTTKPLGQGTGLGLSMIYGFAKQSGGQVRIYSEEGEGTMVCIYLPRHRGEAEQAEVLPEAGLLQVAEEGETVLVVDDEPTVRMLVTDVLGDLGYTAVEAADGAGGLKVLQSDARIDLLVTDVGLPGGMNGRQLADAGRVSRPDLRVLFITGFAENALLNNGQLEPGMAVLTKPFAVDTLAARIRELIAR